MQGIGVSPGVVCGSALRVVTAKISAPGQRCTDAAAAKTTLSQALAEVARDLESRATAATPGAAEVLLATASMASDPELLSSAYTQVEQGHGPVDALYHAVEHYCGVLANLGPYFAQRQDDLRDIFQRAAAKMLDVALPGIPHLTSPVVLVADDLTPVDTATLDPELVLGIVTQEGSATSHTAILAAQLGIPAVVQVAGVLAHEPATIGLDGSTGEVFLDPDLAQVASLRQRAQYRRAAQEASGGPGETRDGHGVQILANIGTAEDIERAAAADVEGAGLFRTEFLFLDRDTAPSYDEQLAVYREAFQAFGRRKVVVRTLDAGLDKHLGFADLGRGENPALGFRGLRLQRELPELLQTQLAALAAAQQASQAEVWVMAPMIATVEEAAWFAQQCRAAGLPTVGTMIEVPAAAVRARHIVAECDFASIGTNDLSQYLFAADRMDARLAPLLDGWQPALWETITATVEAAAGKPVGICGELAGDPLLALVAVGAGISSLSMALSKVGDVKAALRRHDLATCQEMLHRVLASKTAQEAKDAVDDLAKSASCSTEQSRQK